MGNGYPAKAPWSKKIGRGKSGLNERDFNDRVRSDRDGLYVWRGLNVGTHHSDFIIFFIEIVQHEVAERN